MTSEYDAVGMILNELQRAQKKFPYWPADIVHAVAVVAEDAGEAVQAANNMRWHDGDVEAVREELIQTCAMCIRALVNLPSNTKP